MSSTRPMEEEDQIMPVKEFDPTQLIVVVSKEGHEFFLDKRVAMVSKMLRRMLTGTGDFKEKTEGRVDLDFSSNIVEKVIQYFHYKSQYDSDPENRPEFHIEPEIALELMMAGHFLDT